MAGTVAERLIAEIEMKGRNGSPCSALANFFGDKRMEERKWAAAETLQYPLVSCEFAVWPPQVFF